MAARSMNMAMLEFFLRGFPDIYNFYVKVEMKSC